MKKILLITLMITSFLYAYAKEEDYIKKVNSEINKEKPDYDEARLAIRHALEDPVLNKETHTWFTAGMIGYREYSNMVNDAAMGQMVDEEKKGNAITESYEYFLEADKIAMIPTKDKKGNDVVDNKTRAKIVKMIQEYYQQQEFVRYGVFLNEHQDYERAYKAFSIHVAIPDLPMMQDPKIQAAMPKDTTYYQYVYYKALFAIQSQKHQEAVTTLNTYINNAKPNANAFQFLYQEYREIKDTAKAINTLKKAVSRFPDETWFVQNLINYYIEKGKNVDAITYLDKAIKQHPQEAQYYCIRGNIKEMEGKYKEAIADFDKALQINPDFANAHAGKGMAYYHQAAKKQEEASKVIAENEYKIHMMNVDELFKKALRFFETAHRLDKNNFEVTRALDYLYGRFGMNDKLEALRKEE